MLLMKLNQKIMEVYKFKNKNKNEVFYGILKKNKIFKITNSIYSKKINIDYSKFFSIKNFNKLLPINPKIILGVAENYEKNNKNEPLIFLKGANAITNNKNKIEIKFKDKKHWGESELGIVIKKKTIGINKKNVKDYILGYLPVNDITAQNILKRDHHLSRSKSPDCYCPIGESVYINYDFKYKNIYSYHNNTLLRRGSTNEMLWDPYDILINISKWITLNKGDLILSGAPKRVRKRIFLKSGDIFEVKIDGMKKLVNKFY